MRALGHRARWRREARQTVEGTARSIHTRTLQTRQPCGGHQLTFSSFFRSARGTHVRQLRASGGRGDHRHWRRSVIVRASLDAPSWAATSVTARTDSSEPAARDSTRAQAPVYGSIRRLGQKRARVAASVLHEPEWPVQAPKDLSDVHFDYEEGGVDPTLLAEAKEKALQQLEEFGVYEIAPKESTLGSLFDLQVGPLASSSPWKLRSDLWPIR